MRKTERVLSLALSLTSLASGADGERERPVGGAKKIRRAEERGRGAFGWSLEMQQ